MKHLTLKTMTLTLLASLVLTACLNESSQSNNKTNSELPTELQGDGEVVAVINGIKLYKNEFENHVKTRTGQDYSSLNAQAKSQFYDEFIQLEQLSQKARKDGIGNDAEHIIKLRNIEKNLLAQAVFAANDEANPITDELLQQKYSEELVNFEQMSFKARHILLETEEAAKNVIEQLNSGADFEKLAKEKSTGPSGANGGDLGWFTADRMVAPFSAATAALEVGKFSQEPVKTQFGYHVIIKEEEKKAEAPPFDSVRPRLEQQIKQTRVQSILDEVKTNSTVERLLVIEEEKPAEIVPVNNEESSEIE